jgi:hypothetical protein
MSGCKSNYYLGDNAIAPPLNRKLRFTKVIYDYKGKTEQQIKDSVQLEIDSLLLKNPAYKFVDSISHFNNTGGIELQLNFELKSSL